MADRLAVGNDAVERDDDRLSATLRPLTLAQPIDHGRHRIFERLVPPRILMGITSRDACRIEAAQAHRAALSFGRKIAADVPVPDPRLPDSRVGRPGA